MVTDVMKFYDIITLRRELNKRNNMESSKDRFKDKE